MSILVSIAFLAEFLLLANFLVVSLKSKGLSFRLGVAFGILYFIFIPVFMMLVTGVLLLPRVDFGLTSLSDVVLDENISASWWLVAYLFGIISYLYLPEFRAKGLLSGKVVSSAISGIWRFPFLLYLVLGISIFLGSGMLQGGNWYGNRQDFMESGGSLAVLMVFAMNASKVIFLTLLFTSWMRRRSLYLLLALALFLLLDMLLSGNRIYAFLVASMVLLIYFKKYPATVIKYSLLSIPGLYLAGYFASIFRHMRGPLFAEGFPDPGKFIEVLRFAIRHEPPDVYNFLSGISESVNVNVIYGLFGRFEGFLHGATYLKTVLFPIPRSIWQGKPQPITNIAGDFFGSASLVTTYIGEMFMNFSYFGALLSPLLLLFTEFLLIRLFQRFAIYGAPLLFLLGLMLFRMPYSDTMILALFAYAILRTASARWKFSLPGNSETISLKSSQKP